MHEIIYIENGAFPEPTPPNALASIGQKTRFGRHRGLLFARKIGPYSGPFALVPPGWLSKPRVDKFLEPVKITLKGVDGHRANNFCHRDTMYPFTRSIAAPDEDTVATGGKYCFVIDGVNRGRTGKIWNEQDNVAWHYAPRRNTVRYSLRNPFFKSDFVVFDNDEKPAIAIRRTSFIPSRFELLTDDVLVGQIAMTSPLQNRYRIEIDGLPTCVFRMPLFTVYFYGQLNDVTRIWVVVASTRQWRVLVESALDDVRLLASLAFIHNQWFNYS